MTHAGTITAFIIDGCSQTRSSLQCCVTTISWPVHLSSQKPLKSKNISMFTFAKCRTAMAEKFKHDASNIKNKSIQYDSYFFESVDFF